MFGWRWTSWFSCAAQIPTVEGEVPPMMPDGVTAHFSRMVAHGTTGSLDGQLERNQSMLKYLDQSAEMLAMVKPRVMALAHTASSYTLGREGEADLVERSSGCSQDPVRDSVR